jgi:CRP-like cAMP-binding protein
MGAQEELAEGSLLSYLTGADRDYLLKQGIQRKFRSDEVLLREGDPADFLLVIVSGWVRVSTLLEDGREVLYALRGPGDVLGELAALHGWSRTASVRSIAPVVVTQLTSAQLITSLRSRPDIAIAMIKAIAVRLREAEAARVDSAALDVSQRVAVLLARLAGDHGQQTPEGLLIDTPLTQQDIANQIGASRRTVARSMSMLRNRGVLTTGRKRIVIIRAEYLWSLARSEPSGTQRW